MALDDNMFTRLVSGVVMAARENAVMPKYVNKDLAASLAQQGSKVTVRVAGAVTVRDVVPGPTPPSTAEAAPTTFDVSLDYFKEAPFKLISRDLSGLDKKGSYIEDQIAESGRAIANAVDNSLLTLYKKSPFSTGTAGTTPFSTSLSALQSASAVLYANLVSPNAPDRTLLLDPYAYGNAMGLNQLANAQSFGTTDVIREGRIVRALGFNWDQDQNTPYHTKGTATGTPLTNGVQAIGVTSLVTDGWTASVTGILKEGDIITIAGDPNPYVVTADVTSNGAGAATIPISNGFLNRTAGLLVACADNAAITVVGSHRVNLAFHKNFALIASRPLDRIEGVPQQSLRKVWPDPISGVIYTIKITERHEEYEFSVQALWGVRQVRPEFCCRILG